MKIRAARPDDVGVVLDVLGDAAAWLQARGIRQWPERFDSDWVMPAIELGATWLAEVDGGTNRCGRTTSAPGTGTSVT